MTKKTAAKRENAVLSVASATSIVNKVYDETTRMDIALKSLKERDLPGSAATRGNTNPSFPSTRHYRALPSASCPKAFDITDYLVLSICAATRTFTFAHPCWGCSCPQSPAPAPTKCANFLFHADPSSRYLISLRVQHRSLLFVQPSPRLMWRD